MRRDRLEAPAIAEHGLANPSRRADTADFSGAGGAARGVCAKAEDAVPDHSGAGRLVAFSLILLSLIGQGAYPATVDSETGYFRAGGGAAGCS